VEEIEDIGRREFWRVYFSSKYKTLLLGKLNIALEDSFERVYMNSLNLIYMSL